MKYQATENDTIIATVDSNEAPIENVKGKWKSLAIHVAVFGSVFVAGYLASDYISTQMALKKQREMRLAEAREGEEEEILPFLLVAAAGWAMSASLSAVITAVIVGVVVVHATILSVAGALAYAILNSSNDGSRDEPLHYASFKDLPLESGKGSMKAGYWYSWCEGKEQKVVKCTDKVGGPNEPEDCNNGKYSWTPWNCEDQCAVYQQLWTFRADTSHGDDYQYLENTFCLKALWIDGWTSNGWNKDPANEKSPNGNYPVANEIFRTCEKDSKNWKKYIQILTDAKKDNSRSLNMAESCRKCATATGGYVCKSFNYKMAEEEGGTGEWQEAGYLCNNELTGKSKGSCK